MRILIVQSVSCLSEHHIDAYARAGIATEKAYDDEEGLAYARLQDYDLIVRVCGEDEMNVLEFIRGLKSIKCTAPIVVISKENDLKSTLNALRIGADDVLPFTITPEELLVRTVSIIRRSRNYIENVIRIGNTSISIDSRTVSVNDIRCKISPKEFNLLEFMLLRKGTNLSKSVIISHIYGCNDVPDEKIIDVFVCKLRGKLKSSGSNVVISTVWGVGYSLQLDVAPAQPVASPILQKEIASSLRMTNRIVHFES